MSRCLASDATLFDVGDTLTATTEYVRLVSGSMSAAKKTKAKEIFVRIGITGEGKQPFYWLTYDNEAGQEESEGTYQGAVRASGYPTAVDRSAYSSTRVSITEVRRRLGELRKAL